MSDEPMRSLLRDIARYGLRADLTPTVDGRDVYTSFARYLAGLDAGLRERAKAALMKADEDEDDEVTVCDACGSESCWQGVFMCEDSRRAGVRTVPWREALR